MSQDEIDAYLVEHGCFCGGHGIYYDHNCGVRFTVTCPHCIGTGTKHCTCTTPSLRCSYAGQEFS